MPPCYVDSEYARVREVLLCPPSQANHTAYRDPALASHQHALLQAELESLDVRCHLLPPDESLPFQAYTRDSFVPTPWGLLLTRMGFDARAMEPSKVAQWARTKGVPIWRALETGSLEGGDVVILGPALVGIGINSTRTSLKGAKELRRYYQDRGWEVKLLRYGGEYRHLDVVLGLVSARTALCCLEGLTEHGVRWLRGIGLDLLPVSRAEAHVLACNVFVVGEGVIIACDGPERVNLLLEAAGYEVRRVSVSEFVRDKGGVHCLVQALVRDPAGGALSPC
jgi:N-dimethylarginine dimethylaminohydrolase